MNQVLTRTVAPTERIVSVAEVKAHLHVDTSADDDRIGTLLQAAEIYLDGQNGILGRALKTQTWRADSAGFPDTVGTISPLHSDHMQFPGSWRLPLPPTISVTEIAYTDANGIDQVWSSSNYRVIPGGDGQGALIIPADGVAWPSTQTGTPNAARVTFQCGYADPSEVTETNALEQVRAAVFLMVQSMYDSPGLVDIPEVVKTLVAPLRVRHF